MNNNIRPPHLEISDDGKSLRIVLSNGEKSREARSQIDALHVMWDLYQAKKIHVSELESLYCKIIESSLDDEGIREITTEVDIIAYGSREPLEIVRIRHSKNQYRRPDHVVGNRGQDVTKDSDRTLFKGKPAKGSTNWQKRQRRRH